VDIILAFSVLVVCIVGTLVKRYRKGSMIILFCIFTCSFIDIKVINLIDDLVIHGQPVHEYIQHSIKSYADVNFEYITKKVTREYKRPYSLPLKREIEFITKDNRGRIYKWRILN